MASEHSASYVVYDQATGEAHMVIIPDSPEQLEAHAPSIANVPNAKVVAVSSAAVRKLGFVAALRAVAPEVVVPVALDSVVTGQ